MSFSKFANLGSECGPTNGLGNLLTHFGQDRGAQQDRLFVQQTGEGSKLAFKSPSTYAQSSDNLADEFFKQEEKSNVYHSPFQPIQSRQFIREDWTRDFMVHQSSELSSPFEDFEYIYQSHLTKSPMMAQQLWSDEFSIFQHQQAPSSEVSEEEQLAFERAFEDYTEEGGVNTMDGRDWDKEFAEHEVWESQAHTISIPSRSPVNVTCIDEPTTIQHKPTATTNDTQQLETQSSRIEKDEQNTKNRNTEKYEQKEWDRLKPEGKVSGYRAIHPEQQEYKCAPDNPYLLRQDAIEGIEHTTLADNILALEAKVQLDPKDAKAWEELGLKQQENERDSVAITALEKAVSLDPTNCLDAWLALTVSYTNEHCSMDAYNCLEHWISNNSKYKHIIKEPSGTHHQDSKQRHSYITELFLQAARSAPGKEMDADVQVGLGVLFNMSEEYDKAVDCFKSALISRPHDYQLWNKVGATLSNARDTTGAIEMYFNALQINPSFVRARYNLAIGCMNLGQYREAAEHLLTALALQRAAALSAGEANDGSPVNIPNGTNAGIWDSLRLLMYMMNRDDLAIQCNHHNIDAFYGHFDF